MKVKHEKDKCPNCNTTQYSYQNHSDEIRCECINCGEVWFTKECEVTKKNILIANFMGLDVLYGYMVSHESAPNNKVTTMKYHSSWGWLMPVVMKISSIGECGSLYEAETTKVDKSLLRLNIWHTYKMVVEFIKWYNENK
ncbi:MAG: hypothetical protein ACEPOW_13860 [Bacteroidales bacterium]